MDFLALVMDYDGTLAQDGHVSKQTLTALEKLKRSGRKSILVSGRVLDDLLRVFPEAHLFDPIVAENGAVLYCPETREKQLLAGPMPAGFPEALAGGGV